MISMDPSSFTQPPQPQWAAAHAYMLLRGLVCVSYSPGMSAQYVEAHDASPRAPITASLSGSRQSDGSYSIHVHGSCRRARAAQSAIAVTHGEYVDLPIAAATPWIFRGRELEVACLRDGEQVAFVPAGWA